MENLREKKKKFIFFCLVNHKKSQWKMEEKQNQ